MFFTKFWQNAKLNRAHIYHKFFLLSFFYCFLKLLQGLVEHWDINNEMLHGTFFPNRTGDSRQQEFILLIRKSSYLLRICHYPVNLEPAWGGDILRLPLPYL